MDRINAAPAVMAIGHIHHREVWESPPGKAQMTDPGASCGTPEMAVVIVRLSGETEVETHRFFLVAAREEGLAGFGAYPAEASQVLLRLLREWRETRDGAPVIFQGGVSASCLFPGRTVARRPRSAAPTRGPASLAAASAQSRDSDSFTVGEAPASISTRRCLWNRPSTELALDRTSSEST